MEQRQQKQINEAAEKFAEALKESYEALAASSVSAHELNAQLTQDFFNEVIDELMAQAKDNQALAEDLIDGEGPVRGNAKSTSKCLRARAR